MTLFHDILGILAFRSRSLRSLAARRSLIQGLVCFSIGFLAFVIVRNSFEGSPEASTYLREPMSVLESWLNIHLLQMLLFLSLVYVPALIALSNAFAGDGLGFSLSREEYSAHASALLPLWGVLFLIAAPLLPVFLAMGLVDVSAGELWLMASVSVYTIWALKEINYISMSAALGVFGISLLTLPVLFMLTNFLQSLPFFIMIPLVYVFFIRFRELVAAKGAEQLFLQHLHTLTLNPRDADAHYQLGLLHLRRNNWDAAQGYFEQALTIDPGDPDYHYFAGRVFEARGEWTKALAEYEATYNLHPEYRLGDIFREVGKGYLHADSLDKATEFLQYFLARRSSDPEGRYWLAVAMQKAGRQDEMKKELNMILDQARSNPRFFRREHRQWISRARTLLRGTAN